MDDGSVTLNLARVLPQPGGHRRPEHASSGMEHWSGLQHTSKGKGGSGELHKGGRKGKLPTAFDVRDCRSDPQRKGSCKGDPRARKKQCQCLCETSGEGFAKRCRHTPRRRHVCVECRTLVCTGYCWIEERQMCHLCREEQLDLHVCHACAVAQAALGADDVSQGREEFLQ